MSVLFIVLVSGMLLHVSILQDNVVRTSALHNARLYVDALTEFRTLYSSEVVAVASRHGLEITHDYQQRTDAIPLPATLSMLLGSRIGKGSSGANSRLYSPYPFPWRRQEGGLRDQFDHEAWRRLSSNPEQPFYRFENQDGREVFRYAVADRMQESCVGCHNGRPDSPKHDWLVGDLRGVLEVTLPLDGIIQAAKQDLQTTTYFYVITSVLLLLGIVILVVKQWRYSSLLEQDVQTRTAELLREIELRKRFEERLISAKEEAVNASKAKSEFLSHMSHELRTPLNAVIGFSQLLSEEELSDDQQESVQLILSSGRHLLELINDLLDLSRIEAGRLEVHQERVEVQKLLGECKSLLEPIARAKGVSLQISRDCDVYAMVWGDTMRVKQVLINLISNAIKYNRENGSVNVYCEATEHQRLRISVMDTGIGISEELQHHLFQPFERLGVERTHLEGTGIGLALSKRLVEMMDGSIGVESKQGEGSTFWLELAQAQVEYGDEIPATASNI